MSTSKNYHDNEIWAAHKLKFRTSGTLVALGFRTRAEVEAAFDAGLFTQPGIARSSIGVGVSTLLDICIWLGRSEPAPAAAELGHCPRCRGRSGYRTKVVVRYVRHYDWTGAQVDEERIEELSETGGVCRDCEQQLRETCPHSSGAPI